MGPESFIFAVVKLEVGICESRVFAGLFASDEVRDVGKGGGFVQFDEVRIHDAGAHEVNAGEEDAVNVEQGFDAAGSLFVEELPLRLGKAEVVMRVVFGNEAVCDLL